MLKDTKVVSFFVLFVQYPCSWFELVEPSWFQDKLLSVIDKDMFLECIAGLSVCEAKISASSKGWQVEVPSSDRNYIMGNSDRMRKCV